MAFPPENAKILGVGELTRAVKGLIEDAFSQGVWVSGEVSGCRRHSSGHCYLTLKDTTAVLAAIVFRGVALRLKYELRDGLEVIAHGRLTVYEPQGKYQLQIDEIQPKGIGPLELAFRQLKEKLSLRNYFDPARKRPLPRIPRRIALVTSPTGAAVRDMLEILGRRWPAAEVWVSPVRVQGDGAAEEIAAAIRCLNRISLSGQRTIDVIIVGRGGGSLEDLWAFNEECVAEAIFASRIPIVSGVGHETDLTIADLVADVRALTPSEAAERVVPNRLEIQVWMATQSARMRQLVLRRLEGGRDKLNDLAQRRCFRVPLERVRDLEQRLDDWLERLSRAEKQRLTQSGRRVEALAAQLQALSPLNVLARGYSLSRKEADNRVIRHSDQVRPGDRLVTLLQHGRVVSRVEETLGSDHE
jgi:exodeoxyribonuclease VII large subunit